MRIQSLFLLLFLSISQCFSQSSTFLADGVTGNFYKPATRADVEGSPLLFSEWAQGVLYLKDGSKADKFLFNIDLYSNEILFQHDGNPLVVVNPVKELIVFSGEINGRNKFLFRAGYLPVDKNNENTYYQVLQDGPVSLLKQTRKIIKERKEYNQPVVKEFDVIESYFLVHAGRTPERISKSRKSLLDTIGENTGKLSSWTERKGYKCKNEEEMIAVVKAFNENKYNQD